MPATPPAAPRTAPPTAPAIVPNPGTTEPPTAPVNAPAAAPSKGLLTSFIKLPIIPEGLLSSVGCSTVGSGILPLATPKIKSLLPNFEAF